MWLLRVAAFLFMLLGATTLLASHRFQQHLREAEADAAFAAQTAAAAAAASAAATSPATAPATSSSAASATPVSLKPTPKAPVRPAVCWLTPSGTRFVAAYGITLLTVAALASAAFTSGGVSGRTFAFSVVALVAALSGFAYLTHTRVFGAKISATASGGGEADVFVGGRNAQFCNLQMGLTLVLWQVLVLAVTLFHAMAACTCLSAYDLSGQPSQYYGSPLRADTLAEARAAAASSAAFTAMARKPRPGALRTGEIAARAAAADLHAIHKAEQKQRRKPTASTDA